jgi:hypothetical protein
MKKYHKHWMYQEAVQCVAADLDFVEKVFAENQRPKPVSLREDFCGTAAACCEWVRREPGHIAWGVDLDDTVLDWGVRHNLAQLTDDQQSRVHLVHDDVRYAAVPPVDVVLAMNFSYYLFKTREQLRNYFSSVQQSLNSRGLFVLDAFGGSEAFSCLKEKRQCNGFTYEWEQAAFDPISHDLLCHIHFERDDGSRISPAFTYDWRLWTLPEIRELLLEAGFSRVAVYWEGVDSESGEGNGVYSQADRGTADPAWIAYLVAAL